MSREYSSCVFTLLSLLVIGCSGSDQFPTAPVAGTVTSDGKPVTEGMIVFSPIAAGNGTLIGKSATGYIKDGKFTLSTFANGDGAVVGQHAVMVKGKEIPPDDPRDIEWGRAPDWGSTKEQFAVLADTQNQFNIELTPRPKKSKKKQAEDDDD